MAIGHGETISNNKPVLIVLLHTTIRRCFSNLTKWAIQWLSYHFANFKVGTFGYISI